MKKIAYVLALILVACIPQENQLPQAPVQPPPPPDVTYILQKATELREERVYIVTLKGKKEEFTLDLWKQAKNEMAVVEYNVLVGESTFNEWQVGQQISEQFDGIGAVFGKGWTNYVVKVAEKQVLNEYFYRTKGGEELALTTEEYQEALKQLMAAKRETVTIPYANVSRTYLLDRPLSEYTFVKSEPLRRYFATVEIENETFTLDLVKHLRNAATAHEITMEIPRKVYESKSEVWNPQLSAGSAILKGHLSELHGTIKKRWSEVDPKYNVVQTHDGQEMVVPAASLKK